MSASPQAGADRLASMLVQARGPRPALLTLDDALVPRGAEEAVAVQHRTLALLGQAARGWKVGAKTVDGSCQGAPLPGAGILASSATVRRGQFAVLGLELEVGFVFSRSFEPIGCPHSEAEVLGGIGSILATIEIVSSRYAKWPHVAKLAQLADLQNHGALVVGEPVAYRADFPFAAPAASLRYDGAEIFSGQGTNPAGDPRRLLCWTVNHANAMGITVDDRMVVTTGSYTGMHFPERGGLAVGTLQGLPPVSLRILD